MTPRRLRQIALAVLAWVLFAYYWWLVSRRRLNPETVDALALLAALASALCLVTVIWILHNLRVARRAGDRRRSRRAPPADVPTDTLGRALDLVEEVPLREARYVEISLDETADRKRYRCLPHAPGEEGT
jgi:hypothetical protein